jgi:peptidoglycan/xylan/chitin deacetylase (PgdA/CDA1 family)
MTARALLKAAFPVVVHYSGLGLTLAARYSGRGTIFALHSVVTDSRTAPDANLRCPVSKLDQALRWLRRRGIAFVSLDQAIERLHDPDTEPFCAFTFDDGYADSFTHALPVMERHGAPFTVYVTTGMITGEIDAWWFGLEALIRTRDEFELPSVGQRFACADIREKQHTFRTIGDLVCQDPAALDDLKTEIARSHIDCKAIAREQGLSVEQLRRLAAHPLVTIGGHTETHIKLTSASAEEVEREMTSNRDFLETTIDRKIRHFAYPFGGPEACGPREAEIAKSVGFRTAVTTRRGTLFNAHLDNLHALPREPIGGEDTDSSLRCKINGVYRAAYSRLGDPIAAM